MRESLIICLFFATNVYSQEFKIEGAFKRNSGEWYISLVDLSNNTVVHEIANPRAIPQDTSKFSIIAPSGNYAFFLSEGPTFYSVFLPVNLTSDLDLGIISNNNRIPIPLSEIVINHYWSKIGFSLEKHGDTIKYTLMHFKKYDMLSVLTNLRMFDFRTKRPTSRLASIEIDGVVLEKNLLELAEYFKNMPAKDVNYIETLPPTDQEPGGIIRIATHAPLQVFNIKGSVLGAASVSVLLVDLTDNSIAWEDEELRKNSTSEYEIFMYAPNGSYALCITLAKERTSAESPSFYEFYLPVNLTSDINLGIIDWPKEPVPKEKFTTVNNKRILTDNMKKYDMHTVLNMFRIYNFRTPIRHTSHIGQVEIDGVVLKKNVLELYEYLKNMPAENVEYVETLPPTEQAPGGIINIGTKK